MNNELKPGTKVKFNGFTINGPTDEKIVFKPLPVTYIWGQIQFPDKLRYIIEHPDGQPVNAFLDPEFPDVVTEYIKKTMLPGKTFIYCVATDLEIIDEPQVVELGTATAVNNETAKQDNGTGMLGQLKKASDQSNEFMKTEGMMAANDQQQIDAIEIAGVKYSINPAVGNLILIISKERDTYKQALQAIHAAIPEITA